MSRLIPASLSVAIKMSASRRRGFVVVSASAADCSDITNPVTDGVPVTSERTQPECVRSALPTTESLLARLSHFG